MLTHMQKGSVVVDVGIDQGGILETSRPTTHSNPIFEVEGVIHYCVSNMPGALARTSTFALTNATFPYALELAEKGYRKAMKENRALRAGLNVCLGAVTHPEVAKALGKEFVPAENYC
jgi:alanine dehydrogenase